MTAKSVLMRPQGLRPRACAHTCPRLLRHCLHDQNKSGSFGNSKFCVLQEALQVLQGLRPQTPIGLRQFGAPPMSCYSHPLLQLLS